MASGDPSVNEIIAISDGLKADRSHFDDHWEDVRRFGRPDNRSFVSEDMPGEKRRQTVLHSAMEDGWEMLAAALFGMQVNPAVPFVKIRARRERLNNFRDATLWLEDTARRVHLIFKHPRAKFQVAALKMYMDIVGYGTGDIEPKRRPGDIPFFSSRPLRQIYVEEDAEGEINTVYRRFKLKARQAIDQWGSAAGPQVAKAAMEPKTQEKRFEFLHATFPRRKRDPDSRLTANMPVASHWINVEEKHQIRVSGFEEPPILVGRWMTDGEAYGRGRGMKALPDGKMLQRAMRSWIRGNEKVIDPPMMVADDAVISRIIRSGPKAINMVRREWMMGRGKPIQSIDTGARPDIGSDFIDRIVAQIDQAFYKQLLSIVRDPRMTATQFLETLEEALRLFSPFLGNIQSEILEPMVLRLIAMGERQGFLLARPEELEGEELMMEFVSPLARAQQLVEARGVSQTAEIMAPWIAADPELVDIQNTDETYRGVARLLGQRESWLRSDEEVAARRQARREAEAAAQNRQAIVDLANAGGQAAPLLREAREAANA